MDVEGCKVEVKIERWRVEKIKVDVEGCFEASHAQIPGSEDPGWADYPKMIPNDQKKDPE